jgi:hypothetical protein
MTPVSASLLLDLNLDHEDGGGRLSPKLMALQPRGTYLSPGRIKLVI